ncbi:MAG: N-acetylmuramoyl-L-alanine amidase [Bdellovibrionaceae bacterium]|nr:N-acetylmuramoyl-L-alanine amidase [Pseudobdellovibrionaceae bacterium]
MFKKVLFFALLSLSSSALALDIMVDPGHGGVDSGTTHLGVKEKELVLKVAGYLNTLLKEDPQFKTNFTRTTDQHISLKSRVQKAEAARADLFISLHANSNPDSRVRGTELYFQNSLPPDEESLIIADQENRSEAGYEGLGLIATTSPSKKSDISAIIGDLNRQYRAKSSLKMTQFLSDGWKQSKILSKASIKQAPFYVVSKTTMPSVLIEVGFLTHPEEAKKLTGPKYQQEIAQKIYKALTHYKEMMDKIGDQALQ